MSDRMSPLVDERAFDVVPLGTFVALDQDLNGQIVAVSFHLNGSIQYCAIYWYNAERKEVWIAHDEIKSLTVLTMRKTVGYQRREDNVK